MANVEKPIEIVAKNCFYRAVDFTSRDIFDLAVLLENEPELCRLMKTFCSLKKTI